MDIKYLKFTPLGVAVFAGLNELMRFVDVMDYTGNPIYWIEPTGFDYFGFETLVSLATWVMRLLIVAAPVLMLLAYDKIPAKFVKIGSAVLLGLFVFRLLVDLTIGWGLGRDSYFLLFLTFIAGTANLVLNFIVQDPNNPRPIRQPQYGAPVYQQQQPVGYQQAPVGYQQQVPQAGNSMAAQIASLQQLHASGALSDAEFEAAKKRIIEG